MANVSKLKYGNDTYDIKDASARHEAIDSAVTSGSTNLISSGAVKTYVDNSIAALPEPMIFKGTVGTGGTITSLPAAAASNEGFTYKVISNLSTPVVAKIGDTVISNGSAWIVIPSGDEPGGTVTNIATGTGLTGGPITSTGTISHADTSSQSSVSNSGRTYIQSVTLDGMGHVTGLTSATETVVDTDTTYTFASGTNGFTVTPKGGSAQTITVTPSIANNVTGSGTSGYIAKWNGANTVTNGPAFGSSTTTYLRNDGNWGTPPDNDTKNTAGSTDTSSKIFLIGATSQAANPQTYSDNEVYATNGVLTTKSVQVGGTAATMQYNSTNKCIDFVFA